VIDDHKILLELMQEHPCSCFAAAPKNFSRRTGKSANTGIPRFFRFLTQLAVFSIGKKAEKL